MDRTRHLELYVTHIYMYILVAQNDFNREFLGYYNWAETKKPLFLGVRNKSCSFCSYYNMQNITAKPHTCALNYIGPSTAMEQDIIVEGFRNSIERTPRNHV